MTMWLIGAYGADMDGDSEGISLMASRSDGSLDYVRLVATVQSPTFLTEGNGHIYATAEGSRRVLSYERGDDFALVVDGDVDSGGGWPCHIEFIEGGLVVANYEGGELGVVSLAAGGASELVQTLEGSGSGPHEAQDGPHAHASFRVDESTVLSADLGADRILIHTIEGVGLRRTGEVVMPPGTGPRDIVRHPSGLIYVLGEHGKSIHVFEWTAGRLEFVTSIELPGASPTDQAAAIGFGQGGRFIYAGLRGSNRVSVVRASDDGRELTAVGSVSTEGDWPRHLAVDGDVLHVANQLSSTVASFRLSDDGMPVLIAPPTPVASPTYLLPVS